MKLLYEIIYHYCYCCYVVLCTGELRIQFFFHFVKLNCHSFLIAMKHSLIIFRDKQLHHLRKTITFVMRFSFCLLFLILIFVLAKIVFLLIFYWIDDEVSFNQFILLHFLSTFQILNINSHQKKKQLSDYVNNIDEK